MDVEGSEQAGNAPKGSLALIIVVLLAFLVVALVVFSSGWMQVDLDPRMLPQ